MPVCNFVHNRVKTGSLDKALAQTAARGPRGPPPGPHHHQTVQYTEFVVRLHTIMTPTTAHICTKISLYMQ